MMERCCYNCVHSEQVHGLDQVVLICANRPGYRGVWYAVGRGDSSAALPTGVCMWFRQAVDIPELPDGARAVPLTQGKFALVDEADYADIIKHSWQASYPQGKVKEAEAKSGIFYAARQEKRRTILMHRQIMNAAKGLVVDHINHNGLDNRRRNLRVCSHIENMRNMRGHRGRTSRYKGVSRDRRRGKWVADIRHNGKHICIGRFKSETDAAKAYNAKAQELFGEFAYLNEIPPDD